MNSYDLFRAFAIYALQSAQSAAEARGKRMQIWRKRQHDATGGYQESYQFEEFLGFTLMTSWEELLKNHPDPVGAWAAHFLNSCLVDLGGYVGPHPDIDFEKQKAMSFRLIKTALLEPLIVAIERSGTYQVEEGILRVVFDEFQTYWSSETEERELWIPIVGTVPSDEFPVGKVDNDISLGPFEGLEKDRAFEYFERSAFGFGGDDSLSRSHHRIVVPFNQKKQGVNFSPPDRSEYLDAISKGECLLTALRMAGSSRIWAGQGYCVRPRPRYFIDSHPPLDHFQPNQRAWDGRPFSVPGGIEQIDSIYVNLRKIFNGGAMAFPLRWFNSAESALTIEDRLLGYAIAMDSSVLAGLKDELSFRVGIRSASLLSSEGWNSQETDNIARGLYSARSLIVHEGFTAKALLDSKDFKSKLRKVDSELDLAAFSAKARSLVQAILVHFIKRVALGEKLAEIGAQAESRVIESLAPPSPKIESMAP